MIIFQQLQIRRWKSIRETQTNYVYNDCATDLNFSSALINRSHLDLHFEI